MIDDDDVAKGAQAAATLLDQFDRPEVRESCEDLVRAGQRYIDLLTDAGLDRVGACASALAAVLNASGVE